MFQISKRFLLMSLFSIKPNKAQNPLNKFRTALETFIISEATEICSFLLGHATNRCLIQLKSGNVLDLTMYFCHVVFPFLSYFTGLLMCANFLCLFSFFFSVMHFVTLFRVALFKKKKNNNIAHNQGFVSRITYEQILIKSYLYMPQKRNPSQQINCIHWTTTDLIGWPHSKKEKNKYSKHD